MGGLTPPVQIQRSLNTLATGRSLAGDRCGSGQRVRAPGGRPHQLRPAWHPPGHLRGGVEHVGGPPHGVHRGPCPPILEELLQVGGRIGAVEHRHPGGRPGPGAVASPRQPMGRGQVRSEGWSWTPLPLGEESQPSPIPGEQLQKGTSGPTPPPGLGSGTPMEPNVLFPSPSYGTPGTYGSSIIFLLVGQAIT